MNKTTKGKLQVIFGPMFSGKTSELIRRIQRYSFGRYKCIVIRYTHDNRYCEDSIVTHDGYAITAIKTTKLGLIKNEIINYTVIGIDEGQFFPDVVEFCEEMCDAGKKIIVAALDGTFQRKPFGNALNLIPIAESVTKLNSICMSCFKDAPFTRRVTDDTQVELIGGIDKYMSVCENCYNIPSPSWGCPFQNPQKVTKTVQFELL
ncbi:thymidine kinase, cytosolic-like [Cimex lectularius]|uniref:Thymidine kinase n=1 Tax=Cimex lectularius TaxID=79782 RepID=A0A8I6TG67_CIMLE|nr:thymidine kinase, cytosolic-like [Cimex lectularius]XP_014254369.1 thymidine kinase, cytosolic-like [Cimex lectularius]